MIDWELYSLLHRSDFIQETYHYDKKYSAYIAGAVYDVSMIFSPAMGIVIVSSVITLVREESRSLIRIVIPEQMEV